MATQLLHQNRSSRRMLMLAALVALLSLNVARAAPAPAGERIVRVGERIAHLSDRLGGARPALAQRPSAAAIRATGEPAAIDLRNLPRFGQQPLPRSGNPALPPDFLRRLGVPDRPAAKAAPTPAGAFDNAIYELIAGDNATGIGSNWAGAGSWAAINSGAAQLFGPQILDPYYFTRGGQQTIGNALYDSFNAGGYGLGLESAITSGRFAEFAGQPDPSHQWNAGFQNQFYGGAGFSSQSFDPTTLAVLGYDQNSDYNFGSQFLMNTNNFLYSPQYSVNFYDGGWGLQTASRPASAASGYQSLVTRYSGLAQQQLDVFYTDGSLSNLRGEANGVLIALLYRDPVYLYYSYALDSVVQQVAAQSSYYTTLLDQAQTISAWTSPPSDPQTLQQHYYARLVYVYLQAVVAYETSVRIASSPNLASWVSQVSAFLAQRQQDLWNQSSAANWYAGWSNAWLYDYQTSPDFAAFGQDFQQLKADVPAFDEYTRLNDEVVNQLLPAFTNHPDVQQVNNLAVGVLSSPTVAQQINQDYQQYTDQINTLLGSTQYVAELERFYELLNGLVAGDSTYQDMTQVQYLVVLNLGQLREQVYNAVTQCYQYYGDACDPYSYGPVVSLLTSQNTYYLLSNVGAFYELANEYWYLFYTDNPDYQQLDQNSSGRMLTTIQPIVSHVMDVRAAFNAGVDAIPEVQQLHDASASLTRVLRGRQASISGLGIAAAGYPYADLDAHLSRMAQLSDQIRGVKRVRLPIISR